jgi:hypothetical protein
MDNSGSEKSSRREKQVYSDSSLSLIMPNMRNRKQTLRLAQITSDQHAKEQAEKEARRKEAEDPHVSLKEMKKVEKRKAVAKVVAKQNVDTDQGKLKKGRSEPTLLEEEKRPMGSKKKKKGEVEKSPPGIGWDAPATPPILPTEEKPAVSASLGRQTRAAAKKAGKERKDEDEFTEVEVGAESSVLSQTKRKAADAVEVFSEDGWGSMNGFSEMPVDAVKHARWMWVKVPLSELPKSTAQRVMIPTASLTEDEVRVRVLHTDLKRLGVMEKRSKEIDPTLQMEDGDAASLEVVSNKLHEAITRVLIPRSHLDKSSADYVGILVGRLSGSTREVWVNTTEHLKCTPPTPTAEETERMKKRQSLSFLFEGTELARFDDNPRIQAAKDELMAAMLNADAEQEIESPGSLEGSMDEESNQGSAHSCDQLSKPSQTPEEDTVEGGQFDPLEGQVGARPNLFDPLEGRVGEAESLGEVPRLEVSDKVKKVHQVETSVTSEEEIRRDDRLAVNPVVPLPNQFLVGRREGKTATNASPVKKQIQQNLTSAGPPRLHSTEPQPSRSCEKQEVEIHKASETEGRSTTIPTTVDQNNWVNASNLGEMPAIGVENHCKSFNSSSLACL